MRVDGTGLKRVSNGEGKTTCGWFIPGTDRLFFGSSHAHDKTCPVKPDPSKGYVWGLDPFDIYTANRDGTALQRLTNYDVYTAEGVLSPDGKRIVFTSLKDGDLDIYTMNVDGSDVRRLTTTVGYDGGPWWSPDGTEGCSNRSRFHRRPASARASSTLGFASNTVRPAKRSTPSWNRPSPATGAW